MCDQLFMYHYVFVTGTEVRRWQSVTRNTWPPANQHSKMALCMHLLIIRITPDTALPPPQPCPPLAGNACDLLTSDSSSAPSSWSSYLYYCTILWASPEEGAIPRDLQTHAALPNPSALQGLRRESYVGCYSLRQPLLCKGSLTPQQKALLGFYILTLYVFSYMNTYIYICLFLTSRNIFILWHVIPYPLRLPWMG